MINKNRLTKHEFKEMLIGYEYITQILEMIEKSPIGRKTLLNKVGNKYLYEGYVKLSAPFVYADHSQELFLTENDQKIVTCKDHINKHLKILRIILPTEEDLDNYDSYIKESSDFLPDSKKHFINVVVLYKHPILGAIEPDTFNWIIEEMISVCTGGINPGSSLGKSLVEEFIYQYLTTLEDNENLISKPIKWDNPIAQDYVYDVNRVEMIGIESVSQYMQVLTEITKSKVGYEVFYRGHKNTAYSLIPSIFRSLKWRHKERTMFNEMERLCPKSFEGMNTLLDRMVEMQHYELPTRLLDISSNALVALLFACDIEKAEKEDGEVLLLFCHNANLCFGHSDKVTLLTAASQMNYSEQKLLYDISDLFCYISCKLSRLTEKEYIEKLSIILEIEPEEFDENNYKANKISVLDNVSTYFRMKTATELIQMKNKVVQIGETRQEWQTGEKDEIHKLFNGLEIVKRLVRQVQREKPYFENRIIPTDLVGFLFVKPAMLNQRIVKQSGAFMISGLMPEDSGGILKIINKYRNNHHVERRPVIIIPASLKNELMGQLSICDLHQATIYPEIDKVAGYIKEQSEKRLF